MRTPRFTLLLALSLGLLPCLPSQAAVSSPQYLLEAGGSSLGFGQLDVLMPINANVDQYPYVGLSGKYASDGSWLAGVGTGYRYLGLGHDSIFGLLLYVEQMETTYDANFWLVNPGVEWFMGPWDLHLNGQFVIGNEYKTLNTFSAVDAAYEDGILVTGHQLFSQPVKTINTVGHGGNFDVGYTIDNFLGSRIALGGYYNQFTEASDISGAQVDVMLPVNEKLTIHMADSYDNVFNNTFMFSFEFYFDKQQRPLRYNRDYSPPVRHLGNLHTGATVPDQKAFKLTGELSLHTDNIWFFNTSGASFSAASGTTNCTAENPCGAASFVQSTIDGIDSISTNAKLYFASGSYLVNPGGSTNLITLNTGQGMFGRNSSFKLPATGTARPLMSGSLAAGSDNQFENLRLTGSGTNESTGFVANGVDNIHLANLEIANYVGQTIAPVGIDLTNVQNASLSDVTVKSISGATSGDAIGVQGSSLTNTSFNNLIISNISGGKGANGDDGTNGVSNGPNTGSTDGTVGTNGTNAGQAKGLVVADSDKVTFSRLLVTAIKGGNGGKGGI